MGIGKTLLVAGGLVLAYKIGTGVGYIGGVVDGAIAATETSVATEVAQDQPVRANAVFKSCQDEVGQHRPDAVNPFQAIDALNGCVAEKLSAAYPARAKEVFAACRDDIALHRPDVADVGAMSSELNACVAQTLSSVQPLTLDHRI